MFGRKNKEKIDKPDVRVGYDEEMFRGYGLHTGRLLSDNQLLWNLLVQGEVARLNADDGRVLIVKELRQLVETQTAILETQKAILDELRKR